jgi:hypothetical protein
VRAQGYCDFLNGCGWVKEDDTFIVPKEAKPSNDRRWGTLVNLRFAPIEKEQGKYVPKPGMARLPMYYVTWNGIAYCYNWLSLKHGLSPGYLPNQA